MMPIPASKLVPLIIWFILKYALPERCLGPLFQILYLASGDDEWRKLNTRNFFNDLTKNEKKTVIIDCKNCGMKTLEGKRISESVSCCPDCKSEVGTEYVLFDLKKVMAGVLSSGIFDSMCQSSYKSSSCSHAPGTCISDVTDGLVFKEVMRGHQLDPEKDIAYSFCIDGAQVTGNLSIWPITIFLHCGSFEKRFGKPIIAGYALVNSKKKRFDEDGKNVQDLNLQGLLREFAKTARTMMVDGVQFVQNGKVQSSRLIPLLLIADGQGRPKCLNSISPGGYYHCVFCEIEGEYFGAAVRFPLEKKLSLLRTRESFLECSQKATSLREANGGKLDLSVPENRRMVKGMKGSSALLEVLEHFGPNSCTTDSLHVVFEGQTKWEVDQLKNPGNLKTTIYKDSQVNRSINPIIAKIDSSAQSIPPPRWDNLVPPSYMKSSLSWKAKDFAAWLFYYSGALIGICSPSYLSHIFTFKVSVMTMFRDCVNEEDITYSQLLMFLYTKNLRKIYGKRAYTSNSHQLQHLPQNVRNHGPCHVTSSFPAETANSFIVKMLPKNATKSVGLTFTRRLCTLNALNQLNILRGLPDDAKDLMSPFLTVNSKKRNSIPQVLKVKYPVWIDCEDYCFKENNLSEDSLVYTYDFYSLGKSMIGTYKEHSKTDSSIIMFENGSFGRVHRIFSIPDTFVTVRPMQSLGHDILLLDGKPDPTLYRISVHEGYPVCIKISSVKSVCVSVKKFDEFLYVSELLKCGIY